MDCQDVRQRIVEGRDRGPAVRRHLRRCTDCAAYQQRLQETDEFLRAGLPFSVPDTLARQLLATASQSARELQASPAPRPALPTERERVVRQVLYGFLTLLVPACLYLGIQFWRQVLGWLYGMAGSIADVAPMIPSALGYWIGRLGEILAPAREALLFILSFLLVALSLEKMIHSLRQRVASKNASSNGSSLA
jgi:anti-sigma factor RsiW